MKYELGIRRDRECQPACPATPPPCVLPLSATSQCGAIELINFHVDISICCIFNERVSPQLASPGVASALHIHACANMFACACVCVRVCVPVYMYFTALAHTRWHRLWFVPQRHRRLLLLTRFSKYCGKVKPSRRHSNSRRAKYNFVLPLPLPLHIQ